jgi:isopenicillin N synthase-like dioxygenase
MPIGVCSQTIGAFAKGMLELDHAVQKMVLESLGVRKERVDSHLASLVYDVRLSRYGALAPVTAGDDDEATTYMVAHRDCSMVTTITQHEVEGLQVRGRDGAWISVAPEPGTFAVVAGEMLTVRKRMLCWFFPSSSSSRRPIISIKTAIDKHFYVRVHACRW